MYLQRWHGWCRVKLLPSRRVLCTPYNHAQVSFHAKPWVPGTLLVSPGSQQSGPAYLYQQRSITLSGLYEKRKEGNEFFPEICFSPSLLSFFFFLTQGFALHSPIPSSLHHNLRYLDVGIGTVRRWDERSPPCCDQRDGLARAARDNTDVFSPTRLQATWPQQVNRQARDTGTIQNRHRKCITQTWGGKFLPVIGTSTYVLRLFFLQRHVNLASITFLRNCCACCIDCTFRGKSWLAFSGQSQPPQTRAIGSA